MRMRSVFLSGLLFLSAFAGLAGVGLSADTYIIDANAPAGGKVFNSLEALRQAMGVTVFLSQDDVIELRNDDATLTQPITLDTGDPITVRSASGKRYTISSAVPSSTTLSEMFHVEGNSPDSTFNNIHISDTGRFGVSIRSTNLGGSSGTLTINNSLLENNGGTAIYLNGTHTAEINNTILSGYATSIQSNTSNTINISFDKNADFYSIWDGGINSVGGTINVDAAEGKYFRLEGGVSDSFLSTTINKTGEGTFKIGGSSFNRINIQNGTMQFGLSGFVGNSIVVDGKGVFKVTLAPGNPPTGTGFTLTGGFVASAGARMEIGGISRFSAFSEDEQQYYGGMIVADIASSSVASSMTIDNKLLKAYLKSGDVEAFRLDPSKEPEYPDDIADHNGYFLLIDRVGNLDTLEGVGSYADVYRKGNLSEVERDLLDSIYARGGTSGHDRGYLQTIGGSIVQNTLLALRHNQANLLSKINRRLTAYQKEELKESPLEVESSTDVDYYSDWEPCTTYGQMWASLDQSWMSQNDLETLAGYRFSTTTLTIGYDHHMDEWIYGGALAYSSGDMKLKSESGTRSDIKNLLAAIYASWARDGWYVSGTGVAGYGWNDSRSVYALPGMALSSRTGNYSTSSLGINAEFGYMMETELYGLPVRATPYGNLTYARLHRQAVSDTGAYNDTVDLRKKYGSGSWNIWEVAAGVRVSTPLERENYTLVPSVDLAWTRTNGDYGAHGGDVYMMKNPGSTWTVPIMSKNRSSLRAIAGVDMHLRNNITLGANYEFEWRQDYWKNQLNVNMSMDF